AHVALLVSGYRVQRGRVETQARPDQGGGGRHEGGVGQLRQPLLLLLLGAAVQDGDAKQVWCQQVQADRQVAVAELLGRQRAGERRVCIAEAAVLLGQRAWQQPQLPPDLDDRWRRRAALVGIVCGWAQALGGVATNCLDNQLLLVVGGE